MCKGSTARGGPGVKITPSLEHQKIQTFQNYLSKITSKSFSAQLFVSPLGERGTSTALKLSEDQKTVFRYCHDHQQSRPSAQGVPKTEGDVLEMDPKDPAPHGDSCADYPAVS